MPAGAREIFAEGVIVPPLRWTGDVERFLLANVRTPDARRADLAAQRAAVERGADGLRALAARYGSAAVRAAACDLLDYAERRAREALGRLNTIDVVASDWLEGDGVDDVDLEIRVRLVIRDGRFDVDFTGTAPAARGLTVSFAQVEPIVAQRCAPCHSEHPTLVTVAPKGIVLDTAGQIQAQAALIKTVAVDSHVMPLGNVTHMADAERKLLGIWIAQGAKAP